MQLHMQLLGLCCLCLPWLGNAANPFEQLALGALNVGGQIMDTMQDGNKATKEFNIDMPLIKWHSKTDIGHGNAMRKLSDDSDESDERRRRKRSVRDHHHHHDHNVKRGKRSPCFNKMMAATTTESADDVEARRRAAAARKRAANNASRSRIIRRISNKTKKKKLHRERRQVEFDPESMAGQQRPSLGERFKGLWLSLVDNVVDAMQQMRQQLKSAAAQAQAQAQAAGGN